MICHICIYQSLLNKTKKQYIPPFPFFTIYSIDGAKEISLIHSTHILTVIIDSFRTAKSFIWSIFLGSRNSLAFTSMQIGKNIDGSFVHLFVHSNVLIRYAIIKITMGQFFVAFYGRQVLAICVNSSRFVQSYVFRKWNRWTIVIKIHLMAFAK